MPEHSETRFEQLTLPAKRRIDATCARFEEAWRAGRPRLEAFCEGASADELPALLTELLHVEAEFRRRAGEKPSAAEYLTRFPAQQAIVHEVFPNAEQAFTRPDPDSGENTANLGLHVPGYEIIDELGRGGMGVVYRARHLALKRTVALKFILAGSHASSRHRARFRQEAELVARLRHPNISQIYDIGEVDGQMFLALEYAEGGSLRDRLDGTPLEPRAAVQLLEPVARAVQHAHRQGVIHRDIKPANILLAIGGDSVAHNNLALPERRPRVKGDSGTLTGLLHSLQGSGTLPRLGLPLPPLLACTPKLTDFGLAQLLGADVIGQNLGTAAGTPFYMSPEQASGGQVGPATDVWALGVNLYELLTGRPPFRAAMTKETLRLVLQAEPVPPSKLQPGIPRDLDTICLKCLKKDPLQRYAGARELAQDLRHFQMGEPILARPAGFLERALKWMREHPVSAMVAGFVLLMSLVGIAATLTMVTRLLGTK
jgi:serine/threonine protein kinase